jgi:predicted CXXCH cytochrome family protein
VRRLVLLCALVLAGAGMATAQTTTQTTTQTTSQPATRILNSKHDFRANSQSSVRSVNVNDACIFCHTPHNADPGSYLWNHKESNTVFPGYTSSTMKSQPGIVEPKDVSKLCLSCHDGTIAVGDTENNGMIRFLQGDSYALPAGSSGNLAGQKGFADDHPFAFTPMPSSTIRTPAMGDPVQLDASRRLQCTSCHDPHAEDIDPVQKDFLVKPNPASAICLSCHTVPGWAQSAHRQPPNPGEDTLYGPAQGAHTGYVGVSKNGCESCHTPHSAGVAERLLKFGETATCYQCHDGSVARENIKQEFTSKMYVHPVTLAPTDHDASESPASAQHPMPETSSGTPRHVECVDCHNPHFSNARPAQPPLVGGALQGVSGITVAGTYAAQSTYQYEVCFKCHADSANKPQYFDTSTVGIGYGREPQREFNAGTPNRDNTRIEFGFSVSSHPVVRPSNLSSGPGGDVPSLRQTMVGPGGEALPGRVLSGTSLIECTDCHNNDTGRNLGTFTAPAGPHGSNLPHLLERANPLEPPPAMPGGQSVGVAYSPSSYALCNKCHNVAGSVLQNQSFPYHRQHVVNAGAACSTCHDPHASSAPMLINFDLSIVGPSSSGRLQYVRTGPHQGECYLTCHGVNHNPKIYRYTPH